MTMNSGLAEPPVITQVRQLLAGHDPARAVLIGFETVMRDFESAFGFESPPEWTYSDIFRLGIRPDMGYVPVLLARLYRIYEPVRYGGTGGGAPGDLIGILRQIYSQPALQPTRGLEPGLPLGVRARGIPIQLPSAGSAPPWSVP
ncbi:MAG: hypothetical protein L3K14_04985 [Thermoplasmata archaeon]|nr:hypothetical protein [Thermoplasmata archaeon]